MILPTTRGWVFLVAGPACLVIAYGTGQSALLVPGILLLGVLIVGAALLVPIIRHGHLEMRMPADVREGHGDDITLIADPAYVGSQFRWRSIASGHWSAWTRMRSTRGVIFAGDLPRGVYPVEPLRVRVSDPLSVWFYRSRQGGGQSLLVGPQTSPLEAEIQSGFGSQAYANLLGVTDQVDQLVRDHRREDGMRRVHWKQSAKHDRLMARKEEPPAVGSATVILDTAVSSYSYREEFDSAVRTFASLLIALREHGLDVRVRETGQRALPDTTGVMRERELVKALASLEAARFKELKEPGSRERVHIITGENPDAAVAGFIAGLNGHDTVWGANDELVEKGRARRFSLIDDETMELERLFA